METLTIWNWSAIADTSVRLCFSSASSVCFVVVSSASVAAAAADAVSADAAASTDCCSVSKIKINWSNAILVNLQFAFASSQFFFLRSILFEKNIVHWIWIDCDWLPVWGRALAFYEERNRFRFSRWYSGNLILCSRPPSTVHCNVLKQLSFIVATRFVQLCMDSLPITKEKLNPEKFKCDSLFVSVRRYRSVQAWPALVLASRKKRRWIDSYV